MSQNRYLDQMTSASSLPASKDRDRPLFPLGKIVATPDVLDHFVTNGIDLAPYIHSHTCGLWGDVPPEDARENDFSVLNGFRVLSAFIVAGARVWIITEADRSSTTLLFPSEY